MNFMEEINKETQAMLKQISIRKAEKTAVAKKRIAELKEPVVPPTCPCCEEEEVAQ